LRLKAGKLGRAATPPNAEWAMRFQGLGGQAYDKEGIKTMTTIYTGTSIEWAKVDLKKVPHMVGGEVPGPRSHQMHQRAAAIMKGYSSQVRLFPVVFEKGFGCTLTDVDGNI